MAFQGAEIKAGVSEDVKKELEAHKHEVAKVLGLPAGPA